MLDNYCGFVRCFIRRCLYFHQFSKRRCIISDSFQSLLYKWLNAVSYDVSADAVVISTDIEADNMHVIYRFGLIFKGLHKVSPAV
ncbi:hypothetical protein LT40_18295 [Pseudomonas rhizosphaerae]|uniref:Uncharacterized protein n=1 Tax=Pseudomonas rhizosphaerae TaxID=216142 RepID=A0A089YXR6_9PSED|nr:hypothetical protein LT40_18295 [Pseudomonas rhizosphaerae]